MTSTRKGEARVPRKAHVTRQHGHTPDLLPTIHSTRGTYTRTDTPASSGRAQGLPSTRGIRTLVIPSLSSDLVSSPPFSLEGPITPPGGNSKFSQPPVQHTPARGLQQLPRGARGARQTRAQAQWAKQDGIEPVWLGPQTHVCGLLLPGGFLLPPAAPGQKGRLAHACLGAGEKSTDFKAHPM